MTSRARALLLATLLVGLVPLWQAFLAEPVKTRWFRGRPRQPTVLLVVLDTVRADHLGACGAPPGQTPVLDGLRARGAALACDGVAPGSWTLPSHASLFTGRDVPDHGADYGGAGEVRQLAITPLPGSAETLARTMAGRGYQVRGVSANPVLAPATGLVAGFDGWEVAPEFGAFADARVEAPLRRALRSLRPDGGPLFLFVNLAEAHDPWPAISAGDGMFPATPGLAYLETDRATGALRPDGPWQRFIGGRLSAAERDALLRQVRVLYARGVQRADASLGRVLAAVDAHGWADAGLRLVVVSDHGEFLGEHGLLRHGRYVWEANVRVPVLVWEQGPGGAARAVPALPARPSVRDAGAVVRGEPWPARAAPTASVAYPDPTYYRWTDGRVGGSTSAAIWWSDREKLLWMDGVASVVDPLADPLERSGQPLPESHPGAPALAALVARVSARRVGPAAPDPGVIEALQAAGYIAP